MVPSAAEQRATTIFALEGSRIEANDFNFPLEHVWGRRNLYTFNIELGGIDIDTACGSKRRPMAPSHGPRQPQESGASGKKRMLTTCTSAGTTTYETTHRTLASTKTWRTITPSPSCNRATGDSRDPDKNPCITSSGCANPRRDTASTGRRRRRTTITDGRWRRTAGSRWWKRAARGTRWRDGLQLGGSGTSESGDATVTRSSSREGCSSAVHNGRPAPTTTNMSLHQHGIPGYGAPHWNAAIRGVYVRHNVHLQLEGDQILKVTIAFFSRKLWRFLKPLVGRKLRTRKWRVCEPARSTTSSPSRPYYPGRKRSARAESTR